MAKVRFSTERIVRRAVVGKVGEQAWYGSMVWIQQ